MSLWGPNTFRLPHPLRPLDQLELQLQAVQLPTVGAGKLLGSPACQRLGRSLQAQNILLSTEPYFETISGPGYLIYLKDDSMQFPANALPLLTIW